MVNKNLNKYEIIKELSNSIMSRPIQDIIHLRIHPKSQNKYICPFHDDHTPENFKISKKLNRFNCFVCSTKGNGIDFICFYDNIGWKESVVQIAMELCMITSEDAMYLLEETKKGKKSFKKSTTDIQQKPKFIEKKENLAAITTEISTVDMIDKIYSIFAQGYSIQNKNKLTPIHEQEIKDKRHLTNEEIEEDGYFTFPDIDLLEDLFKEFKKNGLKEDDLKGIPGFYYSVPKKRWAFTTLKNTSGIGIPIKNIDGKIVGIQIRLDKVSETKKRYQWFSSSFAGGDGSNGAKSIFGSGPGVPVAVIRPTTLKNGTIFITEGFFKAKTIARTYNCIALSVQGVHNWGEIPKIIEELKKENKHHKNICIAYDGDMGRKDTVMKPALQLGVALNKLDLEESLAKDLTTILKIGNRSLSEKAIKFKEPFKQILKLFIENEVNNNYKISYCLWNEDLGKGIDDIIDGGGGETIRRMYFLDFFENAYQIFCDLDEEKEKLSIEQGIDFKKVMVSDEIKKELYFRHIDSKLNKL